MRKLNEKIVLFLFLICLTCLGTISCVKTPDHISVVDRSKGIPDEKIIAEDNQVPKDLGLPTLWEENIEKNNGFIKLFSNYEMEIPDIYSTPVFSYEILTLSNERLTELCDYFAKGGKIYKEQAASKEELLILKEKMIQREGEWGKYIGSYYVREDMEKVLDRVDELIENASNGDKGHVYIEPQFTTPFLVEEEYLFQDKYNQGLRYYYDTNEEIGFSARIENKERNNPFIRAINHNSKVGSTTAFLYSEGSFIDELDLYNLLEMQSTFGLGDDNYGKYLNSLQEKLNEDILFTEKEALLCVEKIIDDLSLGEVGISDCVRAVGVTTTLDSWKGFSVNDFSADTGYSVYLYPKAGDAIGYVAPLTMYVDSLPEMTYSPSFLTEKIHIIVTDKGIQRFEWTNISERKGIIATNTKLLPFESIKTKLIDHLLYARIAVNGEGAQTSGIGYEYRVKRVQFRAANINAFEDLYAVWLVPVWVFELEETGIPREGKPYDLGEQVVMLNAIDGGYIIVPTE